MDPAGIILLISSALILLVAIRQGMMLPRTNSKTASTQTTPKKPQSKPHVVCIRTSQDASKSKVRVKTKS